MPRVAIRPYTNSIEFNGSTSELLKDTPTGLNTGTNGLSFVTWIYPRGDGLQVVADLLGGAMGRRFSIGGSVGLYYFFSDGVNAVNNMTLTGAQYFAAFRRGSVVRAVWTVDATEASIYVNGVLIKTQTLGLGMNSGTYTKLVIGRTGVPSLGISGWLNDAYFANKKMTLADVQEDYFLAKEPSNMASAWMMNEGTGANILDRIGANNLTASNIAWSTVLPFKARAAAGTRASASVAGVTASAATGSLTITDNTKLEGVPSTAAITITDYTLMTGGNFDLLGMITLTEGVEFDAETSNEVTATNVAAALDIAAGEAITSVVGAVITVTLGGEDNGGEIIWSGTGVSPTTATLAGGLDKVQFLIAGAGFTFPDEVIVGATAADTIEAMRVAVNAYGGLGVNLVANGNVLEITASTPGTDGNAITLEVRPSGGGSIEDDLIASGAMLTGGADAVTAVARSAVPVTASATFATGVITVTDYSNLAGNDATLSITITDYTLMAGGNFLFLDVHTLTEGSTFNAVTSNEVTAQNVAAAITAIPGGLHTGTAVGAVVTVATRGDNNGLQLIWSLTGVSPTTATLTGGFDKTRIRIGTGTFTFGTDVAIGASNDACAANIKTYLDGLSLDYTASRVGSVVTLTAKTAGSVWNSKVLQILDLAGGPLSNGVTVSGATFAGGSDATFARAAIT